MDMAHRLAASDLYSINMFLHDVNYDHFNIAYGDTLINPQHWDDEPFEVIVSNPLLHQVGGRRQPTLINDPRFAPAGVLAPKSKANLAFTMHMLSWLAADGTAAIVSFPACSTVAARSRRSANTCWRATSSMR